MPVDLIDLIYPEPLALEPGRAEARADPQVAEEDWVFESLVPVRDWDRDPPVAEAGMEAKPKPLVQEPPI